MKLSYNGTPIVLSEVTTLAALLNAQAAKPPYAVALNGEFIPRSQLADKTLQDGDSIEVLSPIQGG
ncbi:sulfur carrier protein ThiS [Pseudoalteromonas fenneropenaei]|uniref:Sulfur carrier protein ThiS n=1 Tax=Pseudoalteromonas fenneropenaei TaxID=1737459 RepID=A0ABV7CN58_9GAMM